MNRKRLTIILAAVFAVVAGVGTLLFVRSLQVAQAPEKRVLVNVLVANAPIDKGVTITPSMFHTIQRDQTTLDPDVITDSKAVNNQVSLISIPANSILTSSKIGTPKDVGLSFRLKPGERAMSISVDRVKDISGLLVPGDRVDILAQGPRIDNRILPSVVILRGILVLAVGQGLETTATTASAEQANAATVTLAVNSKQADTLFTADQNAVIRLTLRSPKEKLRSESVQGIVYNGVDRGYGQAAQQRTAAVSAAPASQMLPMPVVNPFAPISVPNVGAAAGLPGAPGTMTEPGTINGVTVIEGSELAGQK